MDLRNRVNVLKAELSEQEAVQNLELRDMKQKYEGKRKVRRE
jgi:hypothetical protein